MINKEERVERAVEYFKKGYNCAQSVTIAFADLYGLTEEQALRISSSFGAGIGRMRKTCGAASGMFLLAGLETGSVKEEDREGKSHNYAVVQGLAKIFEEYNGSLVCAELMGIHPNTFISPDAEARTEEYYHKRPCVDKVRSAARFYAEFLEKIEK